MSRQKKILTIAAAVFLVLLLYASYDMGKRTTFPGSKSQLKERIKKKFFKADSVKSDTIHSTHR